jgi:hypothetical protein
LIPTGGSGTFTGDGVVGNQFDPSLSDTGIIAITHTVTDVMTGCSSSTTAFTTVFESPDPVFTTTDVLCADDLPLNLTGSPSGGTFSGTGVNGNTFDPAISGLGSFAVQYTVTNIHNCSATATDTITVDACANIEENESSLAMVFPNPASSIIHIQYSVENFQFTLLNALGEAILQGCYFIKILYQGKIVQTEKVILK